MKEALFAELQHSYGSSELNKQRGRQGGGEFEAPRVDDAMSDADCTTEHDAASRRLMLALFVADRLRHIYRICLAIYCLARRAGITWERRATPGSPALSSLSLSLPLSHPLSLPLETRLDSITRQYLTLSRTATRVEFAQSTFARTIT